MISANRSLALHQRNIFNPPAEPTSDDLSSHDTADTGPLDLRSDFFSTTTTTTTDSVFFVTGPSDVEFTARHVLFIVKRAAVGSDSFKSSRKSIYLRSLYKLTYLFMTIPSVLIYLLMTLGLGQVAGSGESATEVSV